MTHRSYPSARGRHRTGLRAAARASVLLAALLAASCMQVPDSGPVLAGPRVGSEEEPVLQYVPGGPRPGAGQVEIINGYLDAMRAYPSNPAIVREFLTDQAAAAWSPSAGTRIYADRPEPEQVDRGAVAIETPLTATLNERGTWRTPEGQRLEATFRLQKSHGQWRIANPLAGLLVPEDHFERYYRPYSLYFFDPAQRVLVPEPVYLPQGNQTATLLARGLVAGPDDWLRGAVLSATPSTDPADVSVPVTDEGVAQVQLGSAARGLGAQERELLAAQLSWTLRQVPEVESVRLIVNGAPLVLEDGDNVVEVDSGADYDPSDAAASRALFALRGNQVVTVDALNGRSARVGGRFGSGAVPVSSFAVERSGQTIAAATRGGTTVEVAPLGAEGSTVWFSGARSLLGLQWDVHGLLWAVDRTPAGPAAYVMRDGRVAPVPLGEGAPSDIQAFALSRDGVRLAVVSGRGDDARLMIGRVQRPPEDSLEVEVDRWRVIDDETLGVSRFVDVGWGSPTELTVAADAVGGAPQVFTVRIDGSAVEAAPQLDLELVAVAAAPRAAAPAVVATRPGSLYVQLSDRWSELALDGAFRQPSYVE